MEEQDYVREKCDTDGVRPECLTIFRGVCNEMGLDEGEELSKALEESVDKIMFSGYFELHKKYFLPEPK